MRRTTAPSLLLCLLPAAGCAPSYSPDTYSSAAVQQANKVEQAVVVGVRKVAVSAQGAAGAAAGAAAGGIVGAQAPGSSVVEAFGALGGAVIGGVVGTSIEHAAGDTTAFEYIVRKANGDLLSVTQRDPAALAIGAKVLVISGNQARIVPDYTVTTTSETAKEAPPATAPAPPPVFDSPLPDLTRPKQDPNSSPVQPPS